MNSRTAPTALQRQHRSTNPLTLTSPTAHKPWYRNPSSVSCYIPSPPRRPQTPLNQLSRLQHLLHTLIPKTSLHSLLSPPHLWQTILILSLLTPQPARWQCAAFVRPRPQNLILPPLLSIATTSRLTKFHDDRSQSIYNNPILSPYMSSNISSGQEVTTQAPMFIINLWIHDS